MEEINNLLDSYWWILILFIFFIIFLLKNYNKITIKNHNKKVFLTYGNDVFKKSRERITKEAKSLNLFNDTILETDETILNDEQFKNCLNDSYFHKVFNEKRGGGYWLWKPYIIHKTLNNMNNGDILVYCDAGCVINNNDNNKEKFNEIFNDLNNDKYNIVVHPSDDKNLEKIWSKGDVLKYHNVYSNNKILNERQYGGGRIILIKNKNTTELINKWWETAKNQPQLFDDSPSNIPNKKEFKENRHDQSNISILCKLNDKCIATDLGFIKAARLRE